MNPLNLVSKRTVLRSRLRELDILIARIKDNAFELLAHPDTTQEQIDNVRMIARDMGLKIAETRNQLRAQGYGDLLSN